MVALAQLLTGVLLVTIAVSFAAGLLAWRERPEPGASALVLMLGGVVWWAAFLVFELQADSVARKLLWTEVQWVGVVVIPVAWLLFALSYSGRDEYVSRRVVAALFVVPVVTVVLAATTPYHDLLYQSTSTARYGDLVLLQRTGGPWYWVIAAYTYVLGALGFVPLVDLIRSNATLFRGQSAALLFGSLTPWVTNLLSVAGALPLPEFDPTPIAFAVTGVAFLGALTQFRLFGASPAPNWRARRLVFERMDDAAIVVDSHGYVVDANESAQGLLGQPRRTAIGRPVEELLPSLGSLDDDCLEQTTVSVDGDETPFDVSVTPIRDVRDRFIGRVVTFHDVSQYLRQKQRLEVLNRAFRHNIRTDTQMILGYAGQLSPSSEDEAEAVEILKERTERIRDLGEKARIIVDLLERERDPPQPVPVAELVGDRVERLREAFPEVAVEVGDLPADCRVPGTLRPVVWNVLENAAEHNASDDPRVEGRVEVADGRVEIRVADNGPGIDASEYAAVERGTETQLEHASGLGLWLIHWGADIAGGRVTFADNEPTGAVVTLDAPRLDA
ncbi:histidine kinase N-terminal 7TM domain-containing protein [Halobacterium sp. CBA1126]|uniref:histidine kinase N-terminal 7TM domain-containing protein n=1 Tax=Halobacterium sp. CBA1126 TaxID=2668074 RepID=UPI0018D22475